MMNGWDMNGWGWGAMAFMVVVGLVLVVLLAQLLQTTERRPPVHEKVGDDPERILAGRLARGEINADEYVRLRDVLRLNEPLRGRAAPPRDRIPLE